MNVYFLALLVASAVAIVLVLRKGKQPSKTAGVVVPNLDDVTINKVLTTGEHLSHAFRAPKNRRAALSEVDGPMLYEY